MATGDWILFTDADCWLAPDVIARALAEANRQQADHITLVSGLARGNRWLKAAHLPLVDRIGDPVHVPVVFYSVFNSTWVTMRQGGIRWRDTFYPLAQLGSGNVR